MYTDVLQCLISEWYDYSIEYYDYSKTGHSVLHPPKGDRPI